MIDDFRVIFLSSHQLLFVEPLTGGGCMTSRLKVNQSELTFILQMTYDVHIGNMAVRPLRIV